MTDGDPPNARAAANPMSAGCLRAFLYAVTVPFAMVVAFALGSNRVNSHCSECDMAGVEGLAWALVTLVGLLVVIMAVEAVLAVMRRQQAGDRSQTDTRA